MTADADVRDDDRFVSIASAISEGTPVEWSEEDEGLSEDEAAVLREMRSLESIASAHAQLRLEFSDEPDGPRKMHFQTVVKRAHGLKLEQPLFHPLL